jgi:hypothetical protein
MSSLQQPSKPRALKSLRAIVTGVDSTGQLFRDSAATIIALKNHSCGYLSKNRPALDSVVMVEISDGKETWRSNAKVKSSAPSPELNVLRIGIELERAHPLLIDNSEADETLQPEKSKEVTSSFKPASPLQPDSSVRPTSDPAVPKPAVSAPSQIDAAQPGPVRTAPANVTPVSPSAESITQVVRAVVTNEVAQWKREMQRTLSDQIALALREPLAALEKTVQQELRNTPSVSEDTVRQIAEQAATNAQIEWVGTKMEAVIADALRAALLADSERRRREVSFLVSNELEAALNGPLLDKIQKTISALVDEKMQDKAASVSAQRAETSGPVAQQIASEIEAKLNAFGVQLSRILAERK